MASSPPGVFVTGTGTEVGKTVVAAVIAHMAVSQGRSVNVFKPAVTGLGEYRERVLAEPVWASANQLPDHLLLRLAAGSDQSEDEVSPYRYGPAASPQLAAAMIGEEIDPAALITAARAARVGADLLVCEGIGGFLVPLTPGYLVRDFARELGLPVVIAASPALGTINHTLLTVESVRAAGLEPISVVLTPWPQVPDEVERNGRATIARLGGVAVQTLPRLDLTRPESWPRL